MGGGINKILDPIGWATGGKVHSLTGEIFSGLRAGEKDTSQPDPNAKSSAAADLQAAQTAAAEKASLAQAQRKTALARSRTTFTSPLGVQDEAATAKKTLLGQ